ncbi:hypothetical protein [Nocardia sp. NPDC056000]|uniref:hypothetical protein n=1 Tax=Nocardia sp. NPDC056000 TaxID=3345674 RepID=UPI0035D9A71B
MMNTAQKRGLSRTSSGVAVVVVVLNILPIAVLLGAAYILVLPYALELVIAGMLCLFRGRARQIGIGILMALGVTAAVIGLAIVVVSLWG